MSLAAGAPTVAHPPATVQPAGMLAPPGCHWHLSGPTLLIPWPHMSLSCGDGGDLDHQPGWGGLQPPSGAPGSPENPAGPGMPGPTQTPNQGAAAHPWLVELGIELIAATCLVLLAGTSPRGANTAMGITATLWLVWLMNHYGAGR